MTYNIRKNFLKQTGH